MEQEQTLSRKAFEKQSFTTLLPPIIFTSAKPIRRETSRHRLSLPGGMPKAVGACKCIFVFIFNGFGSDERVSLLIRLWREQLSVLSHHHRRDALAFVLGPLLLTTHDGSNCTWPQRPYHWAYILLTLQGDMARFLIPRLRPPVASAAEASLPVDRVTDYGNSPGKPLGN
jgi:hypothetical protein